MAFFPPALRLHLHTGPAKLRTMRQFAPVGMPTGLDLGGRVESFHTRTL